jgi:hypothetical protein
VYVPLWRFGVICSLCFKNRFVTVDNDGAGRQNHSLRSFILAPIPQRHIHKCCGNNYLKKMRLLTIIFVLTLLVSCDKTTKEECKEITVDNYSVDIEFSSFFTCGVDKRIVLTTLPGSLTYGEKFKLDQLYKIKTKDNCEKPQRDTLVVNVTKMQRDSIFDLANKYLHIVKFNIHVTYCGPIVKETVQDGGNIHLDLCFENQCKSTSYFHYEHLKDVSPELVALMNYIDRLK